MPIKLIPPSPQRRTPYYTARGSHLGIFVDRSLKTSDRTLAKKLAKQIERDIERGAVAPRGTLGFADAASAYMKAGGERTFLAPLIRHFTNTPVTLIDQMAIDNAARAIYPNAAAATINRQVYTPVSAILKRAGIEKQIKRPIGWRGRRRTTWLTPEQAFAIFDATARIEAPAHTRLAFRVLLVTLCYTGMRLSDGLGLRWSDVDLQARTAHLPMTKNGEPRLVYLPAVVVAELSKLPGERAGRVFAFHKGGRLYDMLDATMTAAGVILTERVAFHVFCHTWATWMRQHGGLDTFDLVKTGRWKDAESAEGYAHVVVSEVAKRADMLPIPGERAANKVR